ncbi:MAG: DUF4133 domain-containing protein [Nibricoccus sp.]
MNSMQLNEHDANQGAQSSGEFLGMTGNSGWYLLGSGGATIMMVILLWGVLGVSLLLCLFIGMVLCSGSLAYVFALKNNKPDHYDTDFFESALVEAGVLSFCFGPRARRLANPFIADSEPLQAAQPAAQSSARASSSDKRSRRTVSRAPAKPDDSAHDSERKKSERAKPQPVVARSEYDQLQEKLETTEELLEEALAETE